jgi:hypothetical protein
MKKTKPKTKPVAVKKPATRHKRVTKIREAAAPARKAPAVREPSAVNLLADAIADLAAIAMELRQIADDLRELMSQSDEPEVGELVITEIENPESLEEES